MKNLVVLLLFTLSLAGCASTTKLAKTLPKGSRVAVITNFRDQALFQRVGTTAADNASFYRRLPGLHINSLLTKIVSNDLRKNRQFRVIPIYHHPENDLMSIKISRKNQLEPQVKAYLSGLVAGKNIDTIVYITPGAIDFGDGQYSGSIWWGAGYGLFNRAFLFMQTDDVFAAYKVYVINAHSYQVVAKSSGQFQQREHGIDVAWGRGYSGVRSKTLALINKVLRKDLASHLTSAVNRTGLQ